jgi:hypothetical protein
MAETLALALVGSAGTAATATAAATAATSGLIGTAGAVTFGGLASTALTGFSVLGAISGGNQQASAYKAQAQQSQLAARQEELKGRQQADNIRRSLQATLASQNAAFSARGISLASGTPANLANVSKNEASNDIQIAQFGAAQSAEANRSQAGQSKLQASSAKIAGYTQAATSAYKMGSLL